MLRRTLQSRRMLYTQKVSVATTPTHGLTEKGRRLVCTESRGGSVCNYGTYVQPSRALQFEFKRVVRLMCLGFWKVSVKLMHIHDCRTLCQRMGIATRIVLYWCGDIDKCKMLQILCVHALSLLRIGSVTLLFCNSQFCRLSAQRFV